MFRSEIQYSLMNFLILDLRKRELILFRTNFERSDREREIGIYSLESTAVKNNIHRLTLRILFRRSNRSSILSLGEYYQ
jgi:hypothetical protein